MAYITTRERSDGSTAYRVVWRQNGRGQSETFDNERKARAFRGRVDAADQRWPVGWVPGVGDPQGFDPDQLTVRQWCERAIDSRPSIESRTRADYRRDLAAHLYPVLGDVPIAQVTREDAGRWVNGLTGAPKTIRNLHGLVSSCWNDAVIGGHVARNPFEKLRLPRADGIESGEKVFLTPGEFAQLRDAFPDHYQPFVITLAGTGMRFGEATALKVSHVNIARRTLRIDSAWKRQDDGTFEIGPPKSKKSVRTLDLPDEVFDAIRPLLNRPRDAYLFTAVRGGYIRHSNFNNRIWTPAVSEAACCRPHREQQKPEKPSRYWYPEPCGCPGYLDRRPTPHDLRHSCASWLLEAGRPLNEVQAQLGHESITTTVGTYGHLSRDAGRKSADVLQAVLSSR
jgi:integrase